MWAPGASIAMLLPPRGIPTSQSYHERIGVGTDTIVTHNDQSCNQDDIAAAGNTGYRRPAAGIGMARLYRLSSAELILLGGPLIW